MILLFLFSSFSNNVFAATGSPSILHHQGRLLDSSGNLLGGSSGTNYCLRFSFYDVATGGTANPDQLWPSGFGTPSTMTVNVKNGILNADINTDFDFNSTDEVYLNIEVANSSGGSCVGVSSFETLSPRQRIVSAGYAINSKTVGGFLPNKLTAATAGEIPVVDDANALNITGAVNAGGLSLSLGSDLPGDIYYRDADGNFARLEIGDEGTALIVSSGLPSWQTLPDAGPQGPQGPQGETGPPGGQPLNTNLTSIGGLIDATGFLYNDGSGIFSYQAAGAGDMVLSGIQTVTGDKTFNDGALSMNNVAGDFASNFTNTNTAAQTYTLQNASGTLAFTSDIPSLTGYALLSGATFGGAISATNLSGTNTGDQTNITGNAGTVTNGVYTTGSYSNPSWITAIPYSILSGAVPIWNQNTTGNATTATNLTGLTATISNLNTLTTALGSNAFLNTAFAPINSPTFTGTVGGITAAMVGAPSGSGTSSGNNTGNDAVNSLYSGLATSKQNTLVSGTNIKTINGITVLGSGDITIAGAGGDVTGPASAVSNNVAFFNGTTGKVIKDSGLTLSGSNTGDQTLSGLGGIGLTALSSTATGLTYTNTSGVFSLTSGYAIPTTTQLASYVTGTPWTSLGYLTGITSDSPLSGAGTSASHLVISQANTSTAGYLSSTDWNTFNNKQVAGSYSTDIHSNITALNAVSGINTGNDAANSLYSGLATSKQDTLVSGTNIKTINGITVLGPGDITISGADGDVTGPASAVSNNVAFFNGTTGKVIKDSGLTLSGSNTGDQNLSGYALLSGATFGGAISATNLSGTNTGDQTLSGLGGQPLNTNLTSIGGLVDATGFLYNDGSGIFSYQAAGAGDMVLSGIQTVTGDKTFNDGALSMNNVAGDFASNFTNTNTAAQTYTLQNASGTLAFTSDIPSLTGYALLSGATFGGAISATNLSGTNTGDQTLSGLGGANTALSNLASVAINTSLISDTDSTDDLGSTTKAWANVYTNNIKSVTGNALTLTPIAGQNLNINLATTGDFAVNTNQLYVDTSTGYVGIGTTVPAARLNVVSTGETFRSSYNETNYNSLSTASNGILSIGSNGTTLFKMGKDPSYSNYNNIWAGGVAAPSSTNFSWQTTNSGSEIWFGAPLGGIIVFTINNAQTVPLVVRGTNVGLGYLYTDPVPRLLSVNGSALFVGNVGIGETTPGGKLSVLGGVAIGSSTTYSQAAVTSGNLIIQGNVGIGTTSPTSALSVGSTSQFQVNSSGNIVSLNGVATSFPASNSAGVLTNNGSGTLTWAAAGGTGTVTSVAMTVPTGLSISGTPITTSGTLALSLTSGYEIPTTTQLASYLTSSSLTPYALLSGATFGGAISATNLSGTNTGDQNLFASIPVSGQTTVTATSPTTALTLVAGSNMTIITDNTAKSITFAASSSPTAWDVIGDPSGNGAIAMGATTQTLDWATATTQTALTVDGNALTSGTLLDISSNGTAAFTNQKGLNISLSGVNGTGAQTTYGAYLSNAHGGSGTNVGLYTTALNGTTNLALNADAGQVLIGGTTLSTGTLAKLNIVATNSSNGSTTAIAGIHGEYTFTNGGSAGFIQVGNRFVFTNTPTTNPNTMVGEVIRTVDNTSLANVVRGLEIVSNAGSNTAGENTGIRTTGATFGVQAFTSGLAGGAILPAALYGQNTNSTQGDVLRLYTASMTTAPQMALLYQESSIFTGTGLLMDLGKGTGSFTGNFLSLKNAGVQKMHVNSAGNIFGTFNSANTAALCHATNGAATDEEITDCSGSVIADYAEMYPVEAGINYGDIVSIGEQNVTTKDGMVIKQLVKSNTEYDNKIVGIVSNNYGDFSSTGYNIEDKDNPMPVALNGRVPVKVSTNSESIVAGDYITTSLEAGRAMKATKSGQVIGKALESWNPNSGIDRVMIFIEQGYQAGPESDLAGLVFSSSSISFGGDVTFNKEVEFTLPPLFNNDTGGFAVIKQGDRRVSVTFDKPYIAQPVVNATMSFENADNITDADAQTLFDAGVQSIVVNKSQTGFTILINKNAPRDIRFSWSAFSIKDAKVYESIFEGLTFTPPSVPTPPPVDTTTTIPDITPPPAETPPIPDITPPSAETPPVPDITVEQVPSDSIPTPEVVGTPTDNVGAETPPVDIIIPPVESPPTDTTLNS